MKIAFIGCGNVGAPLASHLCNLGHEVTLATKDPDSESVRKAILRNPGLLTAPSREAVAAADVVFLATPFNANAAALAELKSDLIGKILVDCTNPVGPGLSHGLNNEKAGSQFVQELVPDTKVVKAFTIYGFENFEDNSFPGYKVKPVMMFCGNDQQAKATVGSLIAELGWEPLDVGGLEQALHLEHMTLLWIRLVRSGGSSPHTVWAALKK